MTVPVFLFVLPLGSETKGFAGDDSSRLVVQLLGWFERRIRE